MQDEGEVQTDLTLAVGVHAAARANASFKQMDPCCLAADMGPYDAVLVSECLERMPSPKALLGEPRLKAVAAFGVAFWGRLAVAFDAVKLQARAR